VEAAEPRLLQPLLVGQRLEQEHIRLSAPSLRKIAGRPARILSSATWGESARAPPQSSPGG
jgi:hypothetical protein